MAKERGFDYLIIECFHSRGQHLNKFIGTKESVCIRKEFNSHRTGLGHQHGRRFIVLGHQYGRRDVMWKHSIDLSACIPLQWANIKKSRSRSRSRLGWTISYKSLYFVHPSLNLIPSFTGMHEGNIYRRRERPQYNIISPDTRYLMQKA